MADCYAGLRAYGWEGGGTMFAHSVDYAISLIASYHGRLDQAEAARAVEGALRLSADYEAIEQLLRDMAN